MSREILTRAKTRTYEAFFHEDIQQYKMLPPKGFKRKLKEDPEEERCEKRIALEDDDHDTPYQDMDCDEG